MIIIVKVNENNESNTSMVCLLFYCLSRAVSSVADPEMRWSRRGVMEAAQAGDAERLAALLAEGHSVHESTLDLMTPLHEASLAGREACVRLLLNHGASVRRLDSP